MNAENPLKYANPKINDAKKTMNAKMNTSIKDAKSSISSVSDNLKNASSSAVSSVKGNIKSNYQRWLKYGVFFFLVVYVVIIVVGLFGLPPKILHNAFSFLTGILDYFRLDYTSIGKPPQSDNLVEEGKGIQLNRR